MAKEYTEYLFSINGMYKGTICDEGVIYRKGNYYYCRWVGLGVTKRISKKAVDELSISDLRIEEDNEREYEDNNKKSKTI